jgi:hypothetical protein
MIPLQTRTCRRKNCLRTFRVTETSQQLYCGRRCERDDGFSREKEPRFGQIPGRREKRKRVEG